MVVTTLQAREERFCEYHDGVEYMEDEGCPVCEAEIKAQERRYSWMRSYVGEPLGAGKCCGGRNTVRCGVCGGHAA
jgi:hypothetical protein